MKMNDVPTSFFFYNDEDDRQSKSISPSSLSLLFFLKNIEKG